MLLKGTAFDFCLVGKLLGDLRQEELAAPTDGIAARTEAHQHKRPRRGFRHSGWRCTGGVKRRVRESLRIVELYARHAGGSEVEQPEDGHVTGRAINVAEVSADDGQPEQGGPEVEPVSIKGRDYEVWARGILKRRPVAIPCEWTRQIGDRLLLVGDIGRASVEQIAGKISLASNGIGCRQAKAAC